MTKKSVLIIDDDFDSCKTISDILSSTGYQTTIATNGPQALDIINEGKDFDLITLDIKMPTLRGYELLQILREKTNGKTKIIYVTIIPKEEVEELDNVDGYIQKPLDTGIFNKTIQNIIGTP